MRRHAPLLIVLLSALLLWRTPAFADPVLITITSGSVEFDPHTGEGSALRLFGTGGFSVTAFPQLGATDPTDFLKPGHTSDVRGFWSGNDLPGTATYGGDTFTDLGGHNSANQLQVDFHSSDFIAPPPGSTTTIFAPFTLNGTFLGAPGDGRFAIPTVEAALIGSGIGRLPMTYDAALGVWRPGIAHLDLSFPAAATPEPSTLLLFGAGVATAYASRRRRRAE